MPIEVGGCKIRSQIPMTFLSKTGGLIVEGIWTSMAQGMTAIFMMTMDDIDG